MPITTDQVARIEMLLGDKTKPEHSLRLIASTVAMHGLISSGVSERAPAHKVAKVAPSRVRLGLSPSENKPRTKDFS